MLMMRSLKGFLCFLLAGWLAGGHWAVLQGIAWSQMVGNYVAAYGVAEGLIATVSGEKPCALCNAISRSRAAEGRSKGPLAPSGFKLESKPAAMVPTPVVARPPEESGTMIWAIPSYLFASLSHLPEVPPPRRSA